MGIPQTRCGQWKRWPRCSLTELWLYLRAIDAHLVPYLLEAFPYRDLAGWHRSLLNNYGPKRLMWATDFPWILDDPGYGPLTGLIKELLPELSEQEYEDIMGGTAQRFLRFPARPAS